MNLFNYVCSLLKRHSLTEFGIQNESDFVLPYVVTEDVDDDDEYFKNLIVRVVETKSHIVQELLQEAAEPKTSSLVLPPTAASALHALTPLYRFLHNEVTEESMEKFASELQQNLSLTADYEDPFAQAMKWLLDKINLCLWCMTNLSISPNCNPKFILEFCTEQPSILLAIKKITGLRHLCDREEFLSLLASQSDQSLDLFLGFSAIVKVVDYLFSFNKGTKQVADISVEVEQLLDSILKPESAELSLQLLEDMFSLFFLRRDDVSFQETASDSGGSDGAAEHVPSESSSASLVKADSSMKSKLSSDPSASNNSNSPSSTQTASSVALSSKNKSDISLGFLCQRPDKLQMSLQMLKKRLTAILPVVRHDRELLLRHCKLERYVEDALWRMQVVLGGQDGDEDSECYFSRRPATAVTPARVRIPKTWLAQLQPSVLLFYADKNNRSPGVRQKQKRRQRRQSRRSQSSSSCEPQLIPKLLSEPCSLMVAAMLRQSATRGSTMCAPRQIADMYQLWNTDEGRELKFTLTHTTAAQQLQILKFSTVSGQGSMNRIRIASSVETLVGTLIQTYPSIDSSDDDNDFQSVVLLADLIVSACPSQPEVTIELWNIILRRLETAAFDSKAEPWRTFVRFVECCNYDEQLPGNRWQSPAHSFLPLDIGLRQQQTQHEERIREAFQSALEAFQLPDLHDSANETLETLDEVVNKNKKQTRNVLPRPLMKMSRYLRLLRSMAPRRMQRYSGDRLLEQDVGAIIIERLRHDLTVSGFGSVEATAAQMGIHLVSFLATCLSSDSNLVDFTDSDFIRQLLTYLKESTNPQLAQFVDLYVQTSRNVPSFLSSSEQDPRMEIFRRYLQRPSARPHSTVEEIKTSPIAEKLPRPARQISEFPDSPSPVIDSLDTSLTETEDAASARLAARILEVIPNAMKTQLKHLANQPLLMVEQLLMNGQIAMASEVVKIVRQVSDSNISVMSTSSQEKADEIEKILLDYSTKALSLGLPEISPDKRPNQGTKKGKSKTKRSGSGSNNVFVVPTAVPQKDQWVADTDVDQCPCCQTVIFSMFERRHHCRRCGRVVCTHCSPHRRFVDGYGQVPVRTCVDCYKSDLNEILPAEIRSASEDGRILWRLSADLGDDSQGKHNNAIARREFSYEHAPNLALAMAMVNLVQQEDTADFLLNQASSMLATLHRFMLHGALLDVCSDPLMMFSLIKSLIVSAKMRYSDTISKPEKKNKGMPSRGLARCDALLGQIDLLSLLASANCLHLLPPQPISQLDTWRKLRDRLIETELWSLALDVSTKSGLDAGSVWAAWGIVCLKAGNFRGARQRFQRCMKPSKTSPLLHEIVVVLENLSIPLTGKRTRQLSSNNPSASSSGSPSEALLEADTPQLIIATLARLKDICSGQLVERESRHFLIDEILFYLETFGLPESPFVYLVDKSGRIDMAIQRYTASKSFFNPDVFNQGLLMPCLRTGRVEDLIFEMRRHDASFYLWKNHLLSAAHLLETKLLWNSLYQWYLLTGDLIRASLVAIRRLYLSELYSIETLLARSHVLQDILAHLKQYGGKPQQLAEMEHVDSDKQVPLWWPVNEVNSLQKTVLLQMKVTAHIDACLKEGKLSGNLLSVVRSVTQASNDTTSTSDSLSNSLTFPIPTLLGSHQYRCSSAVLVTCANPITSAFELAWRICSELRVRLDRYFRLSAFVLIRLGQVPALVQLADFLKTHMTSESVGYFDLDELLVECATLTQERDMGTNSPDLELIVQLIKKPVYKIRAFINLKWLKAAYLLAVKNHQTADIIQIQQEANRLQQTAVFALCDKWLRARHIVH